MDDLRSGEFSLADLNLGQRVLSLTFADLVAYLLVSLEEFGCLLKLLALLLFFCALHYLPVLVALLAGFKRASVIHAQIQAELLADISEQDFVKPLRLQNSLSAVLKGDCERFAVKLYLGVIERAVYAWNFTLDRRV